MISGRKLFALAGAGLLAAALGLTAIFPRQAGAVIAASINYQGFLLSKVTNLPLDTPQDLKFAVYNVPSGGAPLFSETRCNVRVSKGRYDVEIGSATPGGLPGDIFMDYTGLWLEIQVDADGDCAGAFEAMTPRVKLQASPYAFNSLYASTASAATSLFRADIIGALPNTTYGAITISTNLFVQGGISVGSISPGQKLAVAGVVESTGNWPSCATAPDYTCGFKFPDGSVQVKAAALTMWDVLGQNLYTINEGNTSVGGLTAPAARLHISSAAGDGGDLLLVSTGTGAAQSQLFLVNGFGQVYGKSFYGDGTTLTGIVRKAGDTMTGQLTVSGSSLTVTSAQGLSATRLRFAPNVEISSAPASVRGGIMLSTHVYLTPGATFYGDGSGLYNITTQDHTKVFKTGDTMTGPLTLANSTLTITGSAFSVTGSTFSVFGGSVAVGGFTYPVRLAVTGGILATSSITAQAGLYADSARITGLGQFYNVTAATGTFWTWDTGTGYSVDTASGIKVRAGIVDAPYFVGNGSRLTAVQGTDSTRVLKSGDMMTGNLFIFDSSFTVVPAASHLYALTTNVTGSSEYSLTVTTGGNVGVRVPNPAAPLEVDKRILISNIEGGVTRLDMDATAGGQNYLRWTEDSLAGMGSRNQGVLGYPSVSWDLVYAAGGTIPGTDGQEVFRVKAEAGGANWRFGIGSTNLNPPLEKFHVLANVLVSTAATNPIFFVSTATNRVAIKTLSPTHALTVNGGVSAVSSITAQGGFFGDGSGLTNLSASAIPQTVVVGSITAIPGGAYDGVVFSTVIYASSKLSIGTDEFSMPFNPAATLHLRGTVRLDQKGGDDVPLEFYPNLSGSAYLRWYDGTLGAKGVLGFKADERDLVYRAAATTMGNGIESFRIKKYDADNSGTYFIVGAAGSLFNPKDRFHVLTGMSVNADGQAPVFFISTGAASVGVSTGTPKERFHVASSLLVGADRGAAVFYVSTQTGAAYTGVGTGSPVEGLHSASSFLVGVDRNTAPALYVSTRTGYTGLGTGYPNAKLDVNGYARVGSSLTVTGTNVNGTEDLFNVKNGTLLVRNDGRVGVGATAPAATLDVNGSAQFGSGVNKSTFTADGFWLPRSMDTASLQTGSPPAVGVVVFNSSINDLCVSTGTAVGQWALTGSKGLGDCF